MYPYRQKMYLFKKKYIAVRRIFVSRNLQMQVASEQIRVTFSINIAPRIVIYIFNGAVQLFIAENQTVMESTEQGLYFILAKQPACGLGTRAPKKPASSYPSIRLRRAVTCNTIWI